MTKQETFKRRVRERMVKTGERYGAARRALLGTADAIREPDPARRREWVAQPENTDAVILANTGRTWDDWVDLIDAGPGKAAGHTAIAAWVHAQGGLTHWWAQGVTVGYERIVGLRMPGQMPDGTFSVSRSRILRIDAPVFRAMLLDDADRADLLPGFDLGLRSKPASKSLRFSFARDGESIGIVMFSLDVAPGDRLRVTVTHEKLDSVETGEHWKGFWSEWLAAIDEVAADGSVTGAMAP